MTDQVTELKNILTRAYDLAEDARGKARRLKLPYWFLRDIRKASYALENAFDGLDEALKAREK